MQFGWAPDANINEYNSYVGAGLRFMGMMPLRREDEAGIAVAHALLNGKLADCREWEGAETTIEITYRAVINKHIAIQPDIQFAFNPAADPSIKNAVVAGVRFEVSF